MDYLRREAAACAAKPPPDDARDSNSISRSFVGFSGIDRAKRAGYNAVMRFILMLPGMLWLLLPPICICHLPERLAGAYSEAPRPEKAPENQPHAPGCPAAKKVTPHVNAEDRVLGDAASNLCWTGIETRLTSRPSADISDSGLVLPRSPLFMLHCLWLL